MYPLYKCEIVDINGKQVDEIDDIVSLQAARAFNTDGSATVVIPNYYKRDIFRLHTRMKLWRYDYRGHPLNFGDTVWFLKKIDNSISDHTYTLTWVDAFAMFSTRIVAYTSLTPYADKTLEEFALVTYNNDLRLDNMMRDYMRENFGEDALDGARLNTRISIERNKNLGPYGEKQAAWQELDSVLSDLAKQSLANGLALYYDLIPVDDGSFTFRIWTRVRGTDRSSGAAVNLTLNDTDGMIDDIHEIEDYTEVATVCYALGYDTGPSQVIERVESSLLLRNDPFSRVEMTVNAADSDVASVLQASARAALNGKRPKRIITARVVENNALRYGDLIYGDTLSVEVAGRKYDVAINAVSTRWDSEGEALDIHLMGEQFIGEILSGGPADPGIDIPGATNSRPIANAGPDQEVDWGLSATLAGSGTDDGLPDPPGALTYKWTQVSGPDDVVFTDDTDPATDVTLPDVGEYVLRLTVSDSLLQSEDEVTITVSTLPTTPPDFGLVEGVEEVAGVGIDGYIYRTSDFQTASGSGGPTWNRVDTTIPDTIYSWVVDPFSPGYIEGVGTINGWIVNDTDIYRVTDLFGSVAAVSVFTFAVPTVAASFHWRTIQASFGAYFPVGVNPWLLCVSYYGDTAGHEGTWATYSVDGGDTWSAEVQISALFDAAVPTRFSPIGVYTSPKTPGLAYTVAYKTAAGGESPRWVVWNQDGTEDLQPAGFTYTLDAFSESEGPVVQDNPWVAVCPPANTKRIEVLCEWSSTKFSSGGFGSHASGFDYADHTDITRVGDHNFVEPGSNATTSGSFSSEYSLTTYLTADWPTNRAAVESSLPVSPEGVRYRALTSADASTGFLRQASMTLALTVTEIELDDGTIYGPADLQAALYMTTDWGATWVEVANFIDTEQGLGGTLHLPWPNNADEEIALYGSFVSSPVRTFRTIKSTGASPVDISPVSGAVTYGIGKGPFGVRAFDGEGGQQYVLVAGIGNETSADPDDDFHAVFVSNDSGATWNEIVAPIADSGAPTNRPAFEAAFGGDTEQAIFIWGPPDYISYSDDFGVTVDARDGNLSSFGVPGFVGIAGGPTGA